MRDLTTLQINATARNILANDLTLYGNQPTMAQNKALSKLISIYTDLGTHKLTGRFAFPLPTGAGKTCSIVAWITALAKYKAPISVAVSASRVEALCDLKRAILDHLERHKVSLSIGLRHSYKYDRGLAEEYLNGCRTELPQGYASEPCSDSLDDCQIALITHALVRGNRDTGEYNTYQGKDRDILIYDESLLISDTRGIPMKDVKAGLGFMTAYGDGERENTGRCKALAYIQRCVRIFEGELKAQKSEGRKPKEITLPELSPSEVERYKQALKPQRHFSPDDLKTFLTFSQQPLRVLETTQGSGFISYDLVVDKSLKSVVVLDASHNIRELVHLDKSIQTVPECENFKVSYQAVTVKHLKYWSGRNTLTKNFQKKKDERTISREICEVVKDIPEDEGIIIFTFKTRKVDFRHILEADLKSSGIDTDAQIIDRYTHTPKDRFIWLTWGNETSHSRFSYCRYVILAGVLHRDDIDLGSAIAGQMNSLLVDIPTEEINRIQKSEIAHSVYQALSRGHSRVIKEGKAGEMTLYLIHMHNDIRDSLAPVMDKVNWVDWKSRFIVNQTKVERIADKLRGYLKGLPVDVSKVSTKKLKTECHMRDVPKQTFTEAVRLVSFGGSGWELERQSLIRLSSVFMQ